MSQNGKVIRQDERHEPGPQLVVQIQTHGPANAGKGEHD